MPSQNVEMRKIPINFGDKEFYLRYDLNAIAYLRHYYGDVEDLLGKHSDEWQIDDVVHLLRSGLMDFHFEQNEDAISKRDFENIKPSIAGIGRLVDMEGLKEISIKIIQSLITAYPEMPIGTDGNF